jgi:hypothetical protein
VDASVVVAALVDEGLTVSGHALRRSTTFGRLPNPSPSGTPR